MEGILEREASKERNEKANSGAGIEIPSTLVNKEAGNSCGSVNYVLVREDVGNIYCNYKYDGIIAFEF